MEALGPAIVAPASLDVVVRPRRGLIQSVLLATDLSSVSERAAAQAIDLCSGLGSRLLIVNVIDSGPGSGLPLLTATRVARIDQVRADREGRLMSIVDEARAARVQASFLVWSGDPGQSIVSAAEAESADLIVVGSRALAREDRLLLGSVSDYVVNNSTCPVLIAR